MNQFQFTRRYFLQTSTAIAAAIAAGRIPGVSAAEAGTLKIWAAPIHKVGAKDWSAMEAQAGIRLAMIICHVFLRLTARSEILPYYHRNPDLARSMYWRWENWESLE